ncbi:MAG: 3-oxoacyl-ACP reductase [Peptococcaceae bacterium BICA1-7]|nr:MAG: 3-oxoacyl-ACP reductase [Peptococcaceae bacterium BICA1-7]HBV96491.1 3-oxoacyl-[acyl-carrier-protein] reductase [Desulfotomaculum sp.]
MYLNGRVAVVTGSSRGIGRAVALALAREGADVVVNYSGREADARVVAETINAMGRRALALKADVADPAQAAGLVEEAVKSLGRLDILVNNAGITRDNIIPRMKEEDWDAVLSVNLKGAFNCIKSAIRPMLKAKWGRIINITSVVGITGNPGQANYCASKAGLIGLTKSAAREFGSRSITVNAVAPGYIVSEMTESMPEEARNKMLAGIPLGRPGMPEDIAALVAFLTGESAAYITGQVIAVDGGMTM